MTLRTLMLLIALCGSTSAQSVAGLNALPLQKAQVFAFGPVGYAGITSKEELEFRAMMALPQDEARLQLEKLYSSGNPQAMSYAIAGMRKLDRGRYTELLVAVRASKASVETMSGCIVSKQNLRTVADDIDSGKYDQWLH